MIYLGWKTAHSKSYYLTKGNLSSDYLSVRDDLLLDYKKPNINDYVGMFTEKQKSYV